MWILVVAIIIVILVVRAMNGASEAKHELVSHHKSRMDEANKNYDGQLEKMHSTVHKVFTISTYSYDTAIQEVEMCEIMIKGIIANMIKINNNLVSEAPKENQRTIISQKSESAESTANHIVEKLRNFANSMYRMPLCSAMDSTNYGRINKTFFDELSHMSRIEATGYVVYCKKTINSGNIDDIVKLDYNKILKCVWFFATEKPYHASDFNEAKELFTALYKYIHLDVVIADLYAKINLAGEKSLLTTIHEITKKGFDTASFSIIASSLMWLNAYQAEAMILQHMLNSGMEMSEKAQARLHSLANGRGESPDEYGVTSSNNCLYFDVSSLAWKDDEYSGLFGNLEFQEKTLTYSLAMRDDNKDIFISQGVTIPTNEAILNKFVSTYADEYGTDVSVQSVDCVALSGSGEERIHGILIASNDCKQLGVLIHIAKIGKKMIIKFYTLFMPFETDLASQKQQALSMFKKLSPTVTMWESSLKDTALIAIEQLLSSSNPSGGEDPAPSPEVPKEIVF